jgi:hypothetical protein
MRVELAPPKLFGSLQADDLSITIDQSANFFLELFRSSVR